MSIPRHYVDEAKTTLEEIDDWFAAEVRAHPDKAISLVGNRAKKIDEQIYERFTNDRSRDYLAERDVNSLRLKCRAGRGRPFGSVPRDSATGTVKQDNDDWIYDSHRIHTHSSNRGDHSVDVATNKSGCTFRVSCVGVAFEDMQRGSGWHDATLHVAFRLTEDAISSEVDSERISLQRELGL